MNGPQKVGTTPSEADVLETKQLWRIRKTIFQMLRDREYVVVPAELNETLDEFQRKFGNMPSKDLPARSTLKHLAAHTKATHEMFMVTYHKGKMGVSGTRILMDMVKDTPIRRVIIVVSEKMTAASQADIQHSASNLHFETFLESELMYNVTEHELVPKHIVMSDEQKKQLMERFSLVADQMMILPRTDPVARYYGLQPGQVVRILRKSIISGHSVCYRIVK